MTIIGKRNRINRSQSFDCYNSNCTGTNGNGIDFKICDLETLLLLLSSSSLYGTPTKTSLPTTLSINPFLSSNLSTFDIEKRNERTKSDQLSSNQYYCHYPTASFILQYRIVSRMERFLITRCRRCRRYRHFYRPNNEEFCHKFSANVDNNGLCQNWQQKQFYNDDEHRKEETENFVDINENHNFFINDTVNAINVDVINNEYCSSDEFSSDDNNDEQNPIETQIERQHYRHYHQERKQRMKHRKRLKRLNLDYNNEFKSNDESFHSDNDRKNDEESIINGKIINITSSDNFIDDDMGVTDTLSTDTNNAQHHLKSPHDAANFAVAQDNDDDDDNSLLIEKFFTNVYNHNHNNYNNNNNNNYYYCSNQTGKNNNNNNSVSKNKINKAEEDNINHNYYCHFDESIIRLRQQCRRQKRRRRRRRKRRRSKDQNVKRINYEEYKNNGDDDDGDGDEKNDEQEMDNNKEKDYLLNRLTDYKSIIMNDNAEENSNDGDGDGDENNEEFFINNTEGDGEKENGARHRTLKRMGRNIDLITSRQSTLMSLTTNASIPSLSNICAKTSNKFNDKFSSRTSSSLSKPKLATKLKQTTLMPSSCFMFKIWSFYLLIFLFIISTLSSTTITCLSVYSSFSSSSSSSSELAATKLLPPVSMPVLLTKLNTTPIAITPTKLMTMFEATKHPANDQLINIDQHSSPSIRPTANNRSGTSAQFVQSASSPSLSVSASKQKAQTSLNEQQLPSLPSSSASSSSSLSSASLFITSTLSSLSYPSKTNHPETSNKYSSLCSTFTSSASVSSTSLNTMTNNGQDKCLLTLLLTNKESNNVSLPIIEKISVNLFNNPTVRVNDNASLISDNVSLPLNTDNAIKSKSDLQFTTNQPTETSTLSTNHSVTALTTKTSINNSNNVNITTGSFNPFISELFSRLEPIKSGSLFYKFGNGVSGSVGSVLPHPEPLPKHIVHHYHRIAHNNKPRYLHRPQSPSTNTLVDLDDDNNNNVDEDEFDTIEDDDLTIVDEDDENMDNINEDRTAASLSSNLVSSGSIRSNNNGQLIRLMRTVMRPSETTDNAMKENIANNQYNKHKHGSSLPSVSSSLSSSLFDRSQLSPSISSSIKNDFDTSNVDENADDFYGHSLLSSSQSDGFNSFSYSSSLSNINRQSYSNDNAGQRIGVVLRASINESNKTANKFTELGANNQNYTNLTKLLSSNGSRRVKFSHLIDSSISIESDSSSVIQGSNGGSNGNGEGNVHRGFVTILPFSNLIDNFDTATTLFPESVNTNNTITPLPLSDTSTSGTSYQSDTIGQQWLEILIIVLKVIILGSIIFSAIFGNLLVIIAVFRHHRLRITTNYFIVSLAFADILVALFAMTFNASVVISGKWIFNMVVCDFWNSCDVLFSTASIMHLSCISYDRYYAIIKPLDYPMKVTGKRVAIMLTCVWISSALISYIPIFTGIYTTEEAMNERYLYTDRCEWIVNIPYALISSTVSFWLPCGIMLSAYYKIYREAIKQEKFIYRTQQMANQTNHSHQAYNKAKHNRNSDQSNNNNNNNNDDDPATHRLTQPKHSNTSENNVIQIQSASTHRNSHSDPDPESGSSTPTKRTISKMKREHKAAKTLGIIMGAFILCWLPFFIWYVTSTILGADTPKIIVDLLFWVGYLNSAMNPIIYAYFNRDFREAFKETLRNIFCRCWRLKCLESQRTDAVSFSCTYRSTTNVGLVENKYVKD